MEEAAQDQPADGGGRGLLMVGVAVLGLVLLAGGAVLVLDGDDDEGDQTTSTTTTTEPAAVQPPTEAGLVEASAAYADAVLALDAGAVHPHFTAGCRAELTIDDVEDILADIAASVEESGSSLSDVRVEGVEAVIEEGAEGVGSTSTALEGPDDFAAWGAVLLPDRWVYQDDRWQIPACEGRVLGWYTRDEAGFTAAARDFNAGTVGPDLPLTYPFLTEECRVQIAVDAYVQNYRQQLEAIELALGVGSTDITMADLIDVSIEDDRGSGTPVYTLPPGLLETLREVGAAETFENPDAITLVYEGGVWRTDDCAAYAPVDDELAFPIEAAIIPERATGTIGDWDLQVTGADQTAGQQLVVGLSLTYRGPGTSTGLDLDFSGLDEAGVPIATVEACETVPDAAAAAVGVSPGQTVSGNLCLEVPATETPTLRLGVEPLAGDDEPLIFLFP